MTKQRRYRGQVVPKKPKRLTISFEADDIAEVEKLADANRELPGQWIRRMIGVLVRDGKVELEGDNLMKISKKSANILT